MPACALASVTSFSMTRLHLILGEQKLVPRDFPTAELLTFALGIFLTLFCLF